MQFAAVKLFTALSINLLGILEAVVFETASI